ncbi:type III-A CRISPR-associated RAMP protein Csm3 [Ilyomonas limi]|uniref:CRISPR system Cms endoribonuclease Csm3 n=1 Tax=Ilyomonas limi TaxID=2575867 RepID=A0A4V6XAS9_9BACT|nr:type III-A CRISPR-associated RAMP protein Csm3 [Ilyomonas limi]TKK65853.1 type III-A CRISPR-associated RAMP protein Csm3 [Ilyomonas limi]
MANKLIKKIEITGMITLLTGLHIGGTNSSMSIGGIDKAVIRNPLTNQPFIPGSSLKGKMRSLLEVSIGANLQRSSAQVPNGPSKDGSAADLFGNATGNDTQKPSRIIVRDCVMTNAKYVFEKTELPYTEGKTEVVIDRITSAANPRQIERVPGGAEFSLNLVVNIWEKDNNEEELMKNLFKSLKLLKDDYLGGHGSRGYGQVAFEIADIKEKNVSSFYSETGNSAKSIKEKYKAEVESLHQN